MKRCKKMTNFSVVSVYQIEYFADIQNSFSFTIMTFLATIQIIFMSQLLHAWFSSHLIVLINSLIDVTFLANFSISWLEVRESAVIAFLQETLASSKMIATKRILDFFVVVTVSEKWFWEEIVCKWVMCISSKLWLIEFSCLSRTYVEKKSMILINDVAILQSSQKDKCIQYESSTLKEDLKQSSWIWHDWS